jgi:hypothetical protein
MRRKSVVLERWRVQPRALAYIRHGYSAVHALSRCAVLLKLPLASCLCAVRGAALGRLVAIKSR